MMRLLLFGQVRDGAEHLHGTEIDADAHSVRELVDWLSKRDRDLAHALNRSGLRFAVDRRFADLDTEIDGKSEVALMSPMSGG